MSFCPEKLSSSTRIICHYLCPFSLGTPVVVVQVDVLSCKVQNRGSFWHCRNTRKRLATLSRIIWVHGAKAPTELYRLLRDEANKIAFCDYLFCDKGRIFP